MRIPARLSLVGLSVDGILVNVSARGVCFVTTDPNLRVEASNFVQIDFDLPGEPATHVTRNVRITRVEAVEWNGAPARRLGVEWDDRIAIDAVAGGDPPRA